MKRDMDLLRKVLFYIEDNYHPGGGPIEVAIDGYTSGEIYEHCILAHQAGYIEKMEDLSTLSGGVCFVGNLTNQGYDYLDSIRSDTIWSKTKEILNEKGLPLLGDIIKDVAKTLISAAAEGAVKAYLEKGGL